MNRRTALRRLSASTLGLYLHTLQAAWAAGSRPVTPGLHELSGQVTVNGQPAHPGMPVAPGDLIVTGTNSHAIYVIGQDAYLQRDQSRVQILSEATKAGLRVITGKLLSVFGKGDKTLQTPNATIGIRGTGCYIETEATRDYFCLCYGIAEIAPLDAPQQIERVQTRHHDRPLYLQANGQHMMVPATVKNHTDAELILLESLVGRYPPFYGQPGNYY